MAAGYGPFRLSCCVRSADAAWGHMVVGGERDRRPRAVMVTVACKENAGCCGVEIGHSDAVCLDMGVERSVEFQRAVGN